jgi:hypothetical protein
LDELMRQAAENVRDAQLLELLSDPRPPAPALRPRRRGRALVAFGLVAGALSMFGAGAAFAGWRAQQATARATRGTDVVEVTAASAAPRRALPPPPAAMRDAPAVRLDDPSPPAPVLAPPPSAQAAARAKSTPSQPARAAPSPPPRAVAPTIVVAVADPADASGPPSLEDAMRRAVGAPSASPPSSAPSFVPRTVPSGAAEHPSLGQVNASLGPVLPVARACVPQGAEPIRAMVRFSPSGEVVRVSAPAAEPDVAACVTRALSAMRVPAFAEPTFSVPVVVRPR